MAAVFLAARTTLARSSPLLEQLKKVLAMSGNGSMSCCSQPGALVVVAALPLCQAQAALESVEQRLLESGLVASRGFAEPPDWRQSYSFACENVLDQALSETFPLRCACIMDCADAVSLVREVGHVVL